jgi:hypothetical protein
MSPHLSPQAVRRSLAIVGCQESAGHGGGGCGIRTREGLHPTRFPSVRPRPLGESSAGKLTGERQQIAPSLLNGASAVTTD